MACRPKDGFCTDVRLMVWVQRPATGPLRARSCMRGIGVPFPGHILRLHPSPSPWHSMSHKLQPSRSHLALRSSRRAGQNRPATFHRFWIPFASMRPNIPVTVSNAGTRRPDSRICQLRRMETHHARMRGSAARAYPGRRTRHRTTLKS